MYFLKNARAKLKAFLTSLSTVGLFMKFGGKIEEK